MLSEQEQWMEALYRAQFHRLLLYAAAVMHNPDCARDVVQDTFHEALLHIDTLMTHSNPGGWLMQTLKYKLMEYQRANRRYLQRVLSLDGDLPAQPLYAPLRMEGESPLDQDALLRQIKQVLTDDEYLLLKRLTLDGASHLQVAKEFHISVYASQKRLERIRKKLKQALTEGEDPALGHIPP